MYSLDLKWFRKANKFTQKECADYFDVSQAFISLIERGENKPPQTFISKILADDNIDKTGLTEVTPPQERDELVLSQQRTIENLTAIISKLTDK